MKIKDGDDLNIEDFTKIFNDLSHTLNIRF